MNVVDTMGGTGAALTARSLPEPAWRSEMAERICSIDGCEKSARARGWCMMHYRRWQRSGDPLIVAVHRGDPKRRLLSQLQSGDNGCLNFTGAVGPGGYGQFFLDGVHTTAHRAAYLLFVGPIPDGLDLDHLCRNRFCCFTGHLEPVTRRENTLRGENQVAVNARKTHCKRGHEFSETNTYHPPRTPWRRICRTCMRDHSRRYEAKRVRQKAA